MSRVLSSGGAIPPVSFGEHLAGSDAFRALFREGMDLVEQAAGYLDGEGREAAKDLPRADALAYAAESMRLTTRLMQLASWLLLQRAVNEGEMTRAQACCEKHKVRLTSQEIAAAPEAFARLPEKLRELVLQSMRLQARILHLDQLLHLAKPQAAPPSGSPVAAQIERLRAAFGTTSWPGPDCRNAN
jgi:regulator of CtrA degradation